MCDKNTTITVIVNIVCFTLVVIGISIIIVTMIISFVIFVITITIIVVVVMIVVAVKVLLKFVLSSWSDETKAPWAVQILHWQK